MAKKVTGYIKLQVPAASANPSPPIGPALGQHGVNIMEFCKRFNAETEKMEKGMPLPVIITVYEDRSFTYVLKTPPATYFIKKAINLPKGSQAPGKQLVATIKTSQLRQIAEAKKADLNANDLDQGVKILAGSARSMGIQVVED